MKKKSFEEEVEHAITFYDYNTGLAVDEILKAHHQSLQEIVEDCEKKKVDDESEVRLARALRVVRNKTLDEAISIIKKRMK